MIIDESTYSKAVGSILELLSLLNYHSASKGKRFFQVFDWGSLDIDQEPGGRWS